MPDPIPPPELSPEEKERREKILWEKVKLYFFTAFYVFVGVGVFIDMNADALRNIAPLTAAKLSKIPLVGQLFAGPQLAKLDRAWLGSLCVFLAVGGIWSRILFVWILDDESAGIRFRKLLTVVGVVLLVTDGMLMYFAVTGLVWGNVELSLPGMLFSVVYMGCLIWLSMVAAKIKVRIHKLENS